MKQTFITVIFLLAVHIVFAQITGKPKAMFVKGAYVHSQTNKEFPKNLLGHERWGIYSFDNEKSNIGATYKSQHGKNTISVYLYPAGEGSEDRLRNEYLSSLSEIAAISRKGVIANQIPTFYSNNGYKVHGIRADVMDVNKRSMSRLTVFECGKWFFKIRITSNIIDSVGVSNLEMDILNEFVPTDLVKMSPLKSEAAIYFAPAAFADSLMLVSVMGGAVKKVRWARENIDSLERAAGFPGLYLELHVESLIEFAQQAQLKSEVRKEWGRQPGTAQYLSELNTIIESGYLREFIMLQYDKVLIVPENVKLDFESYLRWQLSNPISINLRDRFYVISYK